MKPGGFTLVEVIVALLLLCGGLLCVVSGIALATRLVAFGGRRSAAAAFATGQLELWRGTRCGDRGESLVPGGPEFSWTTVTVGNSIERSSITVNTAVAGRVRVDTFTVTGGC